MNENLKTRREHLKVLPLQKRLQAMENIRKSYYFERVLDKKCSLEYTLSGAITFSYTKQGHDYWWNIHIKYFENE